MQPYFSTRYLGAEIDQDQRNGGFIDRWQFLTEDSDDA
jgi:hypothetical protein